MIKYPLLALVVGNPTSRILFAINNSKNKFAIPLFTDGNICYRYTHKLREITSPILLGNVGEVKALIDMASLAAQVRWIVLDPSEPYSINSGEIFQLSQFIAKLNSTKTGLRRRRRKIKNK